MKYEVNDEVYEFNTVLEGSPTVFRHFKGYEYVIYTIAKDSETLEDVVVYQKQYDDYGFYTRTSLMFFSDVDKEKYPNIQQKKRFEIVK